MPMQGRLVEAREVRKGNTIPVQTEGRGLEPRVVADVRPDGPVIHLVFTDGTSWAWDEKDPVLLIEG